jgi:hypothetical protein
MEGKAGNLRAVKHEKPASRKKTTLRVILSTIHVVLSYHREYFGTLFNYSIGVPYLHWQKHQ